MHQSPHHCNPPPPARHDGAAGEQRRPPNSEIFKFQISNNGKVIKAARYDRRPCRSSSPASLSSARPCRCCCCPPVTPAVFVMPMPFRRHSISLQGSSITTGTPPGWTLCSFSATSPTAQMNTASPTLHFIDLGTRMCCMFGGESARGGAKTERCSSANLALVFA